MQIVKLLNPYIDSPNSKETMNKKKTIGNEHKNSEYNQEKRQSQTADKPMAPHGRATHQS